ncbi:MAG: serine/threonine-protein kinase [Thiohalocapsa sp.]
MPRLRDNLKPGARIDRYRVVEDIGKGGFSLVYLAEDEETGDEVLVKEFMPKRLARRDDSGRLVPLDETRLENLHRGRRMFFQEAQAMASLRHPHIVAVLNVFLANNTAYIVMQYERGRNLGQLIRQRGNLSMTLTLRILLPLLDALALMHSRSMLHLDLKPSNIHLRTGHDPLLLDLGAVHLMDNNSRAGSQVITPGYSPPEQYKRDGNIGPWTDVYAIGASLRCCLDGQPPQPAHERVVKDSLEPAVNALRGRYPAWLPQLIDRCMDLDSQRRPQDAGQVLDILRQHQEARAFPTRTLFAPKP